MKSAVPMLNRLLTSNGVPDAELLRRFAADQDADAFTAIVKRHGPMVLGLCKRLTRDAHAGEDAFQAVFLTLSRRARTIRRPESLAAWLFGVARRVALKARAERDRRQTSPTRDAASAAPDPLDRLSVRELLEALDDELARLPLTYRSALILCTIEGKSIEETARQLGATVGAVRGWLQRGRERLRRRFARRGLALPAVLSVTVVLPRAVVASPLVEAAVRIGTSATVAPPAIAALAQGGISIGVKLAGIALLAASVAGIALALMPVTAVPPEQSGQQPAKPPVEIGPTVDNKEGPRVDRFGDLLPVGALARLGSMRLRHVDPLYSVTVSSDGKFLGSATCKGLVCVWDAKTGKQRMRIQDDKFPDNPGLSIALDVALSPDASCLAVAWANSSLSLWDVSSGKKLREIGDDRYRASSVQFSLDGKYLTATTTNVWRQAKRGPRDNDGAAILAEVETGKVVFSSPGKISFLPGGFIHHDPDASEISLHRLGDDSNVLWFKGHEGKITATALSLDGKLLFTLGSDRTIRVWDTATGKETRRLDNVREGIQQIFPTRDVKAVVTFAEEGASMQCWDVASGKILWSAKVDAKRDRFLNALFLLDNKTVVTGHAFGRVRLWDMTTGQQRKVVEAHDSDLLPPILSSDGKTLTTAGRGWQGKSILQWDAATLTLKDPERGHSMNIVGAAISPDSAFIATSGWEGGVRLWESRTGKPIRTIDMPTVSSIFFAPDGRTLVTGDWTKGTVRFWDIATGKEVRTLEAHPKGQIRLALSPDGKRIYTSGSDCLLRCWDFETLKKLSDFANENLSSVLRLVVSPDGKTLATAHIDGALYVWDTQNNKKRYRLQGGARQIGAIGFSPNSELLAWGDGDNGIRLTDVATGREVNRLPEKVDSLDALAFAPDGKTLFWGSEQVVNVVRVWEVHTGQLRRTLLGHDGPARPLSLSADGSLLVTAGSDGSALVWDVRRRQTGGRAAVPPTLEKLAVCWDGLADADAARAFTYMEVFRQSPAHGLPVLAGRLKPVPRVAAEKIAGLLRGLDSDTFKLRDAARLELEHLGESAFADLRVAAAKSTSAGTRDQAERLLKLVEEGRPQRERAVEVLEMIGDHSAIELLKSLASGHPEASLTCDAKGALRRLE